MVIETFKPGKVKELYAKFEEEGRLLPEGVEYIDSWINEEKTICFQLMQSTSAENLRLWIKEWNYYAYFEIIKVIISSDSKTSILND